MIRPLQQIYLGLVLVLLVIAGSGQSTKLESTMHKVTDLRGKSNFSKTKVLPTTSDVKLTKLQQTETATKNTANDANTPSDAKASMFKFSVTPAKLCTCTNCNDHVFQASKVVQYNIECKSDVSKAQIQLYPEQNVGYLYNRELNPVSVLNVVFGESQNISDLQVYICKQPMPADSVDADKKSTTPSIKYFLNNQCKTYIFNMNRPINDKPLLANDGSGLVFSEVMPLSLSGKLPKKFDPTKLTHVIALPENKLVAITASAAKEYFSVHFINVTNPTPKHVHDSVQTLLYKTKSASSPPQEFGIMLTNFDTKETTMYTIRVETVANQNPYIESLKVMPGSLNAAFDEHMFTYLHRIPPSTSSIDLNIKIANTTSTACLVQTSAKMQQMDFDKFIATQMIKNNVTNPDAVKQLMKELIVVSKNEHVRLSLKTPARSTVFVIHCYSMQDPQKFVRYLITTIKQADHVPTIQNVIVPFYSMKPHFDPEYSGVYVMEPFDVDHLPAQMQDLAPVLSEFAKKTQNDWVHLDLFQERKQQFSKHKLFINDMLITPEEYDNLFYYVPSGSRQKLNVRLEPMDPTMPSEAFDIVLDRSRGPWYSTKKALSRLAQGLAALSVMLSSTSAAHMLQSVKLIQFFGHTNTLHKIPESYKDLTESFTTYSGVHIPNSLTSKRNANTAKSVNDISKRSANTAKSVNATSKSSSSRGRSLQMVTDSQSRADRLKQYETNLENYVAKQASAIELNVELNRVFAYTVGLVYMSLVYVVAIIVYAVAWSLYISKTSTKTTLQDNKTSLGIELSASSPRKFGLEWWLSFIKEPTRSDILALFYPKRFWTIFYELTFYPILQLTLGLLFVDSRFLSTPVPILYSTQTPQSALFLGLLLLLSGPVLYFVLGTSLLLDRIQKNVVFSREFYRYHDWSVRSLKAVHSHVRNIPIISRLFSTEIQEVVQISASYAKLSSYQTEYLQNGRLPSQQRRTCQEIGFTKLPVLPYLSLPWFVASRPSFERYLEEQQDKVTDAEDYDSLQVLRMIHMLNKDDDMAALSTETSCLYKNDGSTEMLFSIEPLEKPSHYKTLSTYAAYKNADIGHSYLSLKHNDGSCMTLKAPVRLAYLPALFQLRSFTVHAPFDRLHLPLFDQFSMLFDASPGGCIKYWIFEHFSAFCMCFLLSALNSNSGDIYALLGWIALSIITLVVTGPAMVATASAKWIEHMKSLGVSNGSRFSHSATAQSLLSDTMSASYSANSHALGGFRRTTYHQISENRGTVSRQPLYHTLQEQTLQQSQIAWPFTDTKVREQFHQVLNHMPRSFPEQLLFLYQAYLKPCAYKLAYSEFWSTRFWFVVREVLFSKRCELPKLLVLSFLTVNHLARLNSDGVVLITLAIFSLLVACAPRIPVVLNDIYELLRKCYATLYPAVIFSALCVQSPVFRASVKQTLITNTKNFFGRLFWCSKSVSYAQLQDEELTPALADNISFSKIEDKTYAFNVDELMLVVNELGLHIDSRSEAGALHKHTTVYKMLHSLSPLHAAKYSRYMFSSLPVQVPFIQFLASQSKHMVQYDIGHCAGTFQLVKSNPTLLVNEHTSALTSDPQKDSYYSFYTCKYLIPEQGHIYVRSAGHSYVVSFDPKKEAIRIQGPEIKKGQAYHVMSVNRDLYKKTQDVFTGSNSAKKGERVVLPDISKHFSYTEHPQSPSQLITKQFLCHTSGYVRLTLNQNEKPSIYKPLYLTRAHDKITYEIDPQEVCVDYNEYHVGRTLRYELVLRSKHLRADSENSYTLKWNTTEPRKKLDSYSEASSDGIIYLTWKSKTEQPDFISLIVLEPQNADRGTPQSGKMHSLSRTPGGIRSKKQATIIIDPLETDAHQISFSTLYNNTTWCNMLKDGLKQKLKHSVLGMDVHDLTIPLPKVPCTIVQCVNPYAQMYRVEPNFGKALRFLQANVEELEAIAEHDFRHEDIASLHLYWPRFVSIKECTQFWEQKLQKSFSSGNDDLIATLNSVIAMARNSDPVKFNEFLDLLRDRVSAIINYLNYLKVFFSQWREAYGNAELYAALLHHDNSEWKLHSKKDEDNYRLAFKEFANVKQQYTVTIPHFVYPMTFHQNDLSLQHRPEPQLQLWREELVAWFQQVENVSVSPQYCERFCLSDALKQYCKEQQLNNSSSTDSRMSEVVVEEVIRLLSHVLQGTLNQPHRPIKPVLHYVVPKSLIRPTQLWETEVPTHYAMVRLFPVDFPNPQKVEWANPVWTACFLQMSETHLNVFIPSEEDNALLSCVQVKPSLAYNAEDIMKRFSWNQLQKYSIPKSCFTRLQLSELKDEPYRKSITKLTDVRLYKDLSDMNTKLVFFKRPEDVDDDYVQVVYNESFCNDVRIQNKNYKLMLCHSIANDDKQKNLARDLEPTDVLSTETVVQFCPLTFRLHGEQVMPWESIVDIFSKLESRQKHGIYQPLRKPQGAKGSPSRGRLLFQLVQPDQSKDLEDPSKFYSALAQRNASFSGKQLTADEYQSQVITHEDYLLEYMMTPSDRQELGLAEQIDFEQIYISEDEKRQIELEIYSRQPKTEVYERKNSIAVKSVLRSASSISKQDIEPGAYDYMGGVMEDLELVEGVEYDEDALDRTLDSSSVELSSTRQMSKVHGVETRTNKFADLFAAAKTLTKKATETQIVSFSGDFEQRRYSGMQGALYDHETGETVYKGSWIYGQRWGPGICTFQDWQGNKWKFDGEFVADEFLKGKLCLAGDSEVEKYKETTSQSLILPESYRVISFDGTFYMPQTTLQSYQMNIERKLSYPHEHSSLPMRPLFAETLLNKNVFQKSHEDNIVINIPRAISACADSATLKGSLALAKELYESDFTAMHLLKRDDFTPSSQQEASMMLRESSSEFLRSLGSAELLKSTKSVELVQKDGKPPCLYIERRGVRVPIDKNQAELLSDAKIAMDEYMPHYSKWLQLLSPEISGFDMIQERFAMGNAVFIDGKMYYGEFVHGKPHGLGMLYDPENNTIFHGNFRNGMPNGYCHFIKRTVDENGDVITLYSNYGEYQDGERSGSTTLFNQDNSIVIRGSSKKNLLTGSNNFVQTSATLDDQPEFAKYKAYKGDMQNNKFHGTGQFIWNDNWIYKGTFQNGLRKSGALYDAEDQLVYSGDWKNQLPHGHGTTYYLSGHIYAGEQFQGKRQGIGELYYKSNLIYDGMWLKDVPNGRGTLYCTDGVYEGEFKNGLRSGKGRFVFNPTPDGKVCIYEGNWSNGMPDDVGTYTDANGNTVTLKFVNGRIDQNSVKKLKSGLCSKGQDFNEDFHIQQADYLKLVKPAEGLEDHEILPAVQERVHTLNHMITEDQSTQKKAIETNLEHVSSEFKSILNTIQLDKLSREPSLVELGVSKKILKMVYEKYEENEDENQKKIQVFIQSGEDLPHTIANRKLHPYCRVHIGGTTKRTKPINSAGGNPKWISTLYFPSSNSKIEFEVWDKQPLGADRFVGSGHLDLKQAMESEGKIIKIPIKQENPYVDRKAKSCILASVTLIEPGMPEYLEYEQRCVTERTQNCTCTIQINSLSAKKLDECNQFYFTLTLDNTIEKTEKFLATDTLVNLIFAKKFKFHSDTSSHNVKLEAWGILKSGQEELIGMKHLSIENIENQTINLYKYDEITHSDTSTANVVLSVYIEETSK